MSFSYRLFIFYSMSIPGNFCLSKNSSIGINNAAAKNSKNTTTTTTTSSTSASSATSASTRPQCYLIDFGLSRRFISDGKIREV